MDYNSFKKTLEQNKIHFIGSSVDLLKNQEFQEPLYAIKSSGTYSDQTFLHSLSGIKKSCESFFQSFKIENKDRWGICLPSHHVASFSVVCRSYFGGLKEPKDYKWAIDELVDILPEVTLLSLVPAQIYEIVQAQIKCPQHIKYVFVGGSSLSHNLYQDAKNLGWPIVPCYGSTETFAQMSYSKNGVSFTPFVGWSIGADKKGLLFIQGPALYWGKIAQGQVIKNTDNKLQTKDLAQLVSPTEFKIIGREGGLVKIKGEFFDFNNFKKVFYERSEFNSLYPIIVEEKRNGAGLYLLAEYEQDQIAKKAMKQFSKIRGAFFIRNIPKTAIGKISQISLKDELQVPVLYV